MGDGSACGDDWAEGGSRLVNFGKAVKIWKRRGEYTKFGVEVEIITKIREGSELFVKMGGDALKGVGAKFGIGL